MRTGRLHCALGVYTGGKRVGQASGVSSEGRRWGCEVKGDLKCARASALQEELVLPLEYMHEAHTSTPSP